MPTNINSINEAKHLGELDPIYVLQDSTYLLARTNGQDNRMPFEDFYKQVIDIAKSDTYNEGYNADFINGTPIDTENTLNKNVLMYMDSEGAYVPVGLKPNDIDWSEFDENDFVKIDANGQLIPSNISVTDIKPTSTSAAGRFIRVSDDGNDIVESDFDLDNFLNYPSTSSGDANLMTSGIFVAGYSTSNRDGGDQAYIISSRLRTDPEVVEPRTAQLSISTDSDRVAFRRNDGTLNIENFTPWFALYNESANPLSDSIDSDSSTDIASSKAVSRVNAKIDSLQDGYNGEEILAKLLPVDGSGSELDADRLDGYEFSDLNSMFVNVSGDTITGNLTLTNGKKVRYSKGTSFVDISSSDSNALFDANNPIHVKNGSASQQMYVGGLLVSNNYGQSNLVPSNGIYSSGKITTGQGLDVNAVSVVDNNGEISWNNLKDLPTRIENIGSAATYDVGVEDDQVPRNADILNRLLPSGAVVPFAGSTAPEGWLICDGRAVSRTEYSRLYAYIGVMYGSGNGSTTFNLPDMRDEFVRGASPTRNVGTKEGDEIKQHGHSGTAVTAGSHSHSGSTNTAGKHTHKHKRHKAGEGGYGLDGSGWHNDYPEYDTSEAGDHSHSLSINSNGNHSHPLDIDETGGAETRPRNIVLLYCIKS